jgi:serine/threonine-protein kinase
MVAEKVQPDDRERQLDEVIAGYLEALEAGTAPDRHSLLQRYPHLAGDLAAFFADEACFDGLVAPLKVSPSTPRLGHTSTPSVRAEPAPAALGRDFGDYELLEEAARGGMGIVYKARQRSLNRVVALKVIRDGEWAAPQDVQRFRLEAEAVAQLDHPNIVPVYEVGERRLAADGPPVHYFSMKWIDGGTLAALLASGRWSAATRDGQRAAARLLAQAARAVHYAHQRGILHRDLKPANILLQAHGSQPAGLEQPYVTDFGLAKRVSVDDRLTQTGMAVGTPSYMAPEQAAPDKHRGSGLTMAADVYSLGAILYEMLTGRPPFRGQTMLDTLRAVLEREPERPRALTPALDRDLETICLKCLQKDPARRYASAAALADDLDRFLAGEPIQARPVGRAERLWRWCRRNPMLAATSLLAALALPAALVLLAVVAVNEARHAERMGEMTVEVTNALGEARLKQAQAEQNFREAERQRAEADKHRDEAESQRRAAERHSEEAERQRQLEKESFRQAHAAVNQFYLKLADELERTPGLQPLRKKLLEAGLGYYQNFLKQRHGDATLQRELADAQLDVARITSEIGPRTEAARAYRTALAIYEGLLDATPGDERLRLRAGSTCFNLALMLSITGRPQEAMSMHQRAQGYFEGLLRDRPGHAAAQAGLAEIHGALGGLHRQASRLAEAHGHFVRAVEIRERLVKAHPRNLAMQDALALCYNNLGVIQTNLGRRDDALSSFHKALAIRQRRADAQPKNAGARMALAASLRDIGLAHRARGKHAEALVWLEKARQLRARVAEENPRLIQAQTDLASSLLDVGKTLRDLDKENAAETLRHYEQARAILAKVVALDPASTYLRTDLARAHYTIGDLHRTAKKTDAAARQEQLAHARKAYDKARVLQEKLIGEAPDVPVYRNALGQTLHGLGRVLTEQKRPGEARAVLRAALAHQREAVAKAPEVDSFRRDLARHYGSLIELEMNTANLDAAVAAAQERQKLWPRDGAEQFTVATVFAYAAGQVGKGKASLSAAEEAQRTRYADLAMDALQRARANGFRDRQRLEQHHHLDSLRGRADFRKLLAELGQ